MKQNAMKSYCRKKGAMVLMRHGDRQWVQAGTAFYPLDGWPTVEDMEFLTLMEVPVDEQPTFPLAHWSEPPAKLIPMMEESIREHVPAGGGRRDVAAGIHPVGSALCGSGCT